jgi:hypothetical protein
MKNTYTILVTLLFLQGCGLHFTIVEGTLGTTGFAEEVRKASKTYKAGEPIKDDKEYETLLEKNGVAKRKEIP